ncbi:helix-turn-helix transcriptional regulator [Shouchella miscanthi]|uniref:Helix-turn-helix transcriptional regulator n=1 Tax=Shouchella miscanthi TaxID=2598861 RepID=A0ABU6NN96_9BACI|nr:helix-turn-helix transcriptional regulator [Shouchella miscanthi]
MQLSSEQVVAIRRVFALSQRKFAESLGVSDAYICYVETGKKPLSSRVSSKVSEVYGIDAERLIEIMTIAETFNLTEEVTG